MAMSDNINGVIRKVPSWPIYPLAALLPAWLLFAGLTGSLGVDPVKAMEHQMGEWGLQALIASLAITPIRRFLGVNLIKYRRALGLVSFFYIVAHLLVWLVLDVQIMSQIIADILKRPYITIGMAAFALPIPLAVTSNNISIRKLGANWRKLHKLVYPAALLGVLHYIMLVKGWPIEPFVYLAVLVALLSLRLIPGQKRKLRAARA